MSDTNKCWLDNFNCPYGSPEGVLVNAPISFCVNCYRLDDKRRFIEKLLESVIGEEVLEGKFDERVKEKTKEDRDNIKSEALSLGDLLCEIIDNQNGSQNNEAIKNAQKEVQEIRKKLVAILTESLNLDEIEVVKEKDI